MTGERASFPAFSVTPARPMLAANRSRAVSARKGRGDTPRLWCSKTLTVQESTGISSPRAFLTGRWERAATRFRARATRRGHSLIEVLVVMSAGAAVMAVAVGLFGTLLSMDRQVRQRAQQRSELDRLADQFRRDVHAAARAKPLAAPGPGALPGWQFQSDSGPWIEYRMAANELVRTQRSGGKVQATESFRLPLGTRAAIRLDDHAAPPVVGLRLIADEGEPLKPRLRALRVDAVLGTDHRFLGTKGP